MSGRRLPLVRNIFKARDTAVMIPNMDTSFSDKDPLAIEKDGVVYQFLDTSDTIFHRGRCCGIYKRADWVGTPTPFSEINALNWSM